MRKYGLLLLLITSPLLFANFGMVEYAADSLARKEKKVNLYIQASTKAEVNTEDDKANNFSWSSYLILGMKAIGGFLLNLLAKF
jgi:5'(3')-deoxyribonucleotidase